MKLWDGKRVLIIGAARQGLALTRYFTKCGADVTLNDRRTSEELINVINENTDLPVKWVLGSHPLDLLHNTDLVCISGGVPTDLAIVKEALARTLTVTNDSQVFMKEVPCPVVGITGSAGKTTTTALLGDIARIHFKESKQVWVGGNIGIPLIDKLDLISPNDLVILELSSFQLELMTKMPQVGAILNITPNHLDRHKTLEAYRNAKARLLIHQTKNDIAILGTDDQGAWSLVDQVKGKLIRFGENKPAQESPGTYMQDNKIFITDGFNTYEIMPVKEIQLPGKHNLQNIMAACACAYAVGILPESMREGIVKFAGVSHRLEFVSNINGVKWYNDSIATAPERTIAAINSFNEPLVVLLGGRDKDLPWGELAELIHQRVDHIIAFGEAAPIVQKALTNIQKNGKNLTVDLCEGLEEAVKKAHAIAQPGDVVLLSPGGTSFDEFDDFEKRGESYRRWVKELTQT